jgi:hypothetical protein
MLLLAETAAACISVAPRAPEFLHGATRVFRGTSTEVFGFKVVKVYRGDDVAGDEVGVLLNLFACGQPQVTVGEDYLVVEWPGREYARALAFDRSADEVTFLESREKPTTRAQLIDTLRSWRDGKLSADQSKAWFDAAKLRDVDDWDEIGSSLGFDVISTFAEWFDAPRRPQATCPLQSIVGPHVEHIVLLLRMPVDQTDLVRDTFSALQDQMVCPEEDDAP